MDSIEKIRSMMRLCAATGQRPTPEQLMEWDLRLGALTKGPVARLAVDQKYPNDVIKHAIYEVVILDRNRCYDGMELFAAPPAPAAPTIIKEAIEAAFEQRPGFMALIAQANRALDGVETAPAIPDDVMHR